MALLLFFLFVLLVAHSFVTYPLSLYWLSRVKGAAPLGEVADKRLHIAVAMCCRNEAKILPQKLEEFSDWLGENERLSVYIYNDASSDGTADLLAGFAETHAGRVVVVAGEERQGKTVGMNTLVKAMAETVDVILFTDPAVRVTGPVLLTLQRTFADDANGCVTGDLQFVNADESTSAGVSGLFGRIQHTARELEMATGSVLGAGGTFFAIRKELYHEMPSYIMDDLHTSVHVVTQHKRAVYAPDIVVFKRAATGQQEEFNRKVRIACRQMNVLKYIWPRLCGASGLDQYKFHSRYTVRWFVGYFLVGAALSFLWVAATLGLFKLVFSLGLIGVGVLWIGHLRQVPILSQIVDALFMLYGVSLGIYKSFRGEKFQTWQSAKSIRQGH